MTNYMVKRWSAPVEMDDMTRRVWFAFVGRFVVLVVALAVLAGAASFARPEPGHSYNGKISWSAFDPDTGRRVPRAEYIGRALAEGQVVDS